MTASPTATRPTFIVTLPYDFAQMVGSHVDVEVHADSSTEAITAVETLFGLQPRELRLYVTEPESVDCPDCEGRGEIGHWDGHPSDTSYLGATDCVRCDGTGEVPETSV